MQTHFIRRLIVFLVAGSLVAISGCAQVKFAPPSPEMRSQLGKVGVVLDTAVKVPSMEAPKEPVKGMLEGMASGAKQGARYGFSGVPDEADFTCRGLHPRAEWWVRQGAQIIWERDFWMGAVNEGGEDIYDH